VTRLVAYKIIIATSFWQAKVARWDGRRLSLKGVSDKRVGPWAAEPTGNPGGHISVILILITVAPPSVVTDWSNGF